MMDISMQIDEAPRVKEIGIPNLTGQLCGFETFICGISRVSRSFPSKSPKSGSKSKPANLLVNRNPRDSKPISSVVGTLELPGQYPISARRRR